jgi:hypothetical protein
VSPHTEAIDFSSTQTPVLSRVIDPRSAHGAGLPLCIEPTRPTGKSELMDWVRTQKERLSEAMTRHGAVLLRGFPIDSAEVFEEVLLALGAELKNDYQGTSPRNAVTKYIFNASELPGFYPIPQHCEMSFLRDPPQRLFFCCLVAPQSFGGETPLCDFRAVYRDLDPLVRSRFEQKGVRIVRNYGGPEGSGRLDLWQLKPWHDIFGTTDRAAVEKKCQQIGQEWEWLPSGRLRLINRTDARSGVIPRRASRCGSITRRSFISRAQRENIGGLPSDFPSCAITCWDFLRDWQRRTSAGDSPTQSRRCRRCTETDRRFPMPTWKRCAMRSGTTWW